MLQNVCENCIRILEEEKLRQLRMFVILCKKVKETAILIDKPKREKPKTVRTPEKNGGKYCDRSTYRRCRFCQKKKKIVFSNEAHFDLGGHVNKENCRIWGTENPHVYIEKPTHPDADFGPES